jgi:hypothetical protein
MGPPCVKVFVMRAVSSDRFFGERATTGKQPLATGSRGSRLCVNTKSISQISILAILDQQTCTESSHNRLNSLVLRGKNSSDEFSHTLGRHGTMLVPVCHLPLIG